MFSRSKTIATLVNYTLYKIDPCKQITPDSECTCMQIAAEIEKISIKNFTSNVNFCI